MGWTSSDEQLYQALMLEQRLSTGTDTAAMESLRTICFSCTVYEVLINKGQGIRYYWKMPKRWYADPLNAWNIVFLIFWIPINIGYFCFQSVRSLASARSSLGPPRQHLVRLESDHLSIDASPLRPRESIPYMSMTGLGHYANGVRINAGRKTFLLNTESAPVLFMALRHLAPGAAVTSGLIVPNGFVEQCATTGRDLILGQMYKNPSHTWISEAKDYSPSLPVQAMIGYGLIALFVIWLIFLFI